jgi:hypothetical protein
MTLVCLFHGNAQKIFGEAWIIPQNSKVYLYAIANRRGGTEKAPPKSEAVPRRETMKIMLLAAAAALSLGVGSAYANESGGQAGGYVYPNYQFPTHNAPPAVAAQNGQASQLFVTHSQTLNNGTWLFPPDQFGGGNN